MSTLLSRIPVVSDGKHVPFVLGVADDTRCLAMHGFELRRGPDTCYFSLPLDAGLYVRTVLQVADARTVALYASTGPILAEWWSMIESGKAIDQCPILSAVAERRPTKVAIYGFEVTVDIRQIDDPAAVLAIAATTGGLDDEALTFGFNLSLAVSQLALRLLVEYRLLVKRVPDVNVPMGAHSVGLNDLIDVAEQLIPALPGELVV